MAFVYFLEHLAWCQILPHIQSYWEDIVFHCKYDCARRLFLNRCFYEFDAYVPQNSYGEISSPQAYIIIK